MTIQRSLTFEFDQLPADDVVDSPFVTVVSDEDNSQSGYTTMNGDDTSSSHYHVYDPSQDFDHIDSQNHDHHHHHHHHHLLLRQKTDEDMYGPYYDDDSHDEVVRRLPSDYTPSETDVVCARGKAYWEHTGNRRYRHLIQKATERYSSSTNNKLEKTLIVSEIVNAVHSVRGKFIKKEGKGGPWVEVDEVFAREKVGQSLRDGLSTKYRSATKAKKHRRDVAIERFNGDIDKVIQSNRKVSQRINDLLQDLKRAGKSASDDCLVTLFNRANSDILEIIKNDASMLNQFQDASNAATVDRNEMSVQRL